jgi:CelD/BcsL family acetyltransferase involved in cellulose biosynthesis
MVNQASARPLPATVPAQEEIHVETINGFQAFRDLEPAWNEVAAKAGLDHPFLEHAWVRTWWECFGAGSTLQILLVKANEEIVAIAPLILTPIRMWGIKMRRLGFLHNAHVPRADYLIARSPQDAYRIIWDHLSRRRDWDLLQFCQLPEESPTLAALAGLAARDRYQCITWVSGASPYLQIRGTWDRYCQGLSAKHRSNLRNRFKRLSGLGPVSVETITAGAELADALEAGLRLEAAAWKGGNCTAICSDPDVSRFYSTLAVRAAERGWIRLHFLRAGSRRIAFEYCLAYGNRIYLLKVGYDPEYALYSPSNLLVLLSLKDLFEQGGVNQYDFLGESADWKRQWTHCAKPHYWLFVFSRSFKGYCLHFIKARVVPLLRRECLKPLRAFVIRLTAHAQPERA